MKPSDVPPLANDAIDDMRIVRLAHDRGWPRKFIMASFGGTERREFGVRRLPAPWVGGVSVMNGTLGVLDDERLRHGVNFRICAVCGLFVCPEGMDSVPNDSVCGPLVFMRYRATNILPELLGAPLTDGPGCCVRCATMAAKFCPHLTEQLEDHPGDVIAFVYTGDAAGCARVPEHRSLVVVREPYTPVTHPELLDIVREWAP